MTTKELIRAASSFGEPYRITKGKKLRLEDIDPGDTQNLGHEAKPRAKEMLQRGVEALAELQERLYAEGTWAVLLIFQAMDSAGKDSAIKHVMSGVNPQGCEVCSFKSPTSDDLAHDYLWRCVKQLPSRGRIGIFNRSYYEELLVVRVHEDLLHTQRIPAELITKKIWKQRYEDIRRFERYLAHNGVAICKFFLHVSKEEQKKRFLARIDDKDKHWKFSPADLKERGYWGGYMQAYEDMITHTASKFAPWYVVPADNKWFTRVVVATAVIDTIAGLNVNFPQIDAAKRAELAAARKQLMQEK